MDRWLGAALDYIPRWLEFQMRQSELPGCSIAIARRGRILLEQAFGHADLSRGVPLTPRHRFRVASHSKSFTAAGIMRLREQRKLKLDDTAGRFIRDHQREWWGGRACPACGPASEASAPLPLRDIGFS